MRSSKLIVAAFLVVSLVPAEVQAQSDRKKPNTNNSVITAPKGTVVAPSKASPKSQGTTAPRGNTVAPLTAQECTGLGGKVVSAISCFPSARACSTVDKDGVVRSKCLTIQ